MTQKLRNYAGLARYHQGSPNFLEVYKIKGSSLGGVQVSVSSFASSGGVLVFSFVCCGRFRDCMFVQGCMGCYGGRAGRLRDLLQKHPCIGFRYACDPSPPKQ